MKNQNISEIITENQRFYKNKIVEYLNDIKSKRIDFDADNDEFYNIFVSSQCGEQVVTMISIYMKDDECWITYEYEGVDYEETLNNFYFESYSAIIEAIENHLCYDCEDKTILKLSKTDIDALGYDRNSIDEKTFNEISDKIEADLYNEYIVLLKKYLDAYEVELKDE